MIVCLNCSHTNPEGAVNCEACYTSLPATKACPTCGTPVQLDATFCGQCGHSFKSVPNVALETASVGLPATVLTSNEPILPPLMAPSTPEAIQVATTPTPDLPTIAVNPPVVEPVAIPAVEPVVATPEIPVATQIQQSAYQLFHLQTNKAIELPPHLTVVLLGKPNEQSPPDIDVSGFPCSEVVSRIHANIRIEENKYYLEDLGSANGTYINHNVLVKGNRHLLSTGDRIGLGKGDLVTFLFQNGRA
jgi:hypothetical protein